MKRPRRTAASEVVYTTPPLKIPFARLQKLDGSKNPKLAKRFQNYLKNNPTLSYDKWYRIVYSERLRGRQRGTTKPKKRFTDENQHIVPHLLAKIDATGRGTPKIVLDMDPLETVIVDRQFTSQLVSLSEKRLATKMSLIERPDTNVKHYVSGTISNNKNSSYTSNTSFLTKNNLRQLNIPENNRGRIVAKKTWSGLEITEAKAIRNSTNMINKKIDAMAYKTNGDKISTELTKVINSTPGKGILKVYSYNVAKMIVDAFYSGNGLDKTILMQLQKDISEECYTKDNLTKLFFERALLATLDRPAALDCISEGQPCLLDLPKNSSVGRTERTWYHYKPGISNNPFNSSVSKYQNWENPSIQMILNTPDNKLRRRYITILDMFHDFGKEPIGFDLLKTQFGRTHATFVNTINTMADVKNAEDSIGILFQNICSTSTYTKSGDFRQLNEDTKEYAAIVDAMHVAGDVKYVYPFTRGLDPGSSQPPRLGNYKGINKLTNNNKNE